jgi:hypothetical protein
LPIGPQAAMIGNMTMSKSVESVDGGRLGWFWERFRVLSLLLTVFLIAAGPAWAYRTEHVVLVIVDGLRYCDGLGDSSHAYVPEMYELSRQGSIVEPFVNDWVTDTMHGIPTIWCGAHSELRTFSGSGCDGHDYTCSELPTVFEYYRKHLSRERTDCIYALKDVNGPWRASLDSDYGPDYWPLYHSEGVSDSDVWHEAEDLLVRYHPSLFLLYLERVDHFGHSGSWPYYTRAIEIADSIVGMLWDFIESDPVYAGKTTLIVTNDHGRHTDDWTTHGCDCEGCRTVMMLAVGPDTRRGFVSNEPRTIRDITPTIGELLGFETPKATGTPMLEILIESD